MLIVRDLKERELFPKKNIRQLYDDSFNSIESQDEYYQTVGDLGFISSGGWVLTDLEAIQMVDHIMSLPIGNDDKYLFLHFLDMDVQNHGESFRPIDNILAAQWELIK